MILVVHPLLLAGWCSDRLSSSSSSSSMALPMAGNSGGYVGILELFRFILPSPTHGDLSTYQNCASESKIFTSDGRRHGRWPILACKKQFILLTCRPNHDMTYSRTLRRMISVTVISLLLLLLHLDEINSPGLVCHYCTGGHPTKAEK